MAICDLSEGYIDGPINIKVISITRNLPNKILKLHVADPTGFVNIVALGFVAKKFAMVLNKHQVYEIARFDVKKNKFSEKRLDIHLKMNSTVVHKSDLNVEVPVPEFTNLYEIADKENDDLIDIKAKIADCGGIETISTKQNKVMKKRDVLIKDDIDNYITLTVWGEKCERNYPENMEIVARHVLVQTFLETKKLTTIQESTIEVIKDSAQFEQERTPLSCPIEECGSIFHHHTAPRPESVGGGDENLDDTDCDSPETPDPNPDPSTTPTTSADATERTARLRTLFEQKDKIIYEHKNAVRRKQIALALIEDEIKTNRGPKRFRRQRK